MTTKPATNRAASWTRRATGLAIVAAIHGASLAACDVASGAPNPPVAGPTAPEATEQEADRRAEAGELEAAIALRRAALETREAAKSPPATLVDPLHRLADLLARASHEDEASKLHARALALGEEAFGKTDARVVDSLQRIGEFLLSLGRLEESEAAMRRALAIVESAEPDRPMDVAACLSNLGSVLLERGGGAEAIQLFQRSLELRERELGPDDAALAPPLAMLGHALRSRGRLAEALAQYERALDIRERHEPDDAAGIGLCVNNVASLLEEQGNLVAARAAFDRALKLFEAALPPGHPHLAVVLNNLGMLLRSVGSLREARTLVERALAIDEAAYGKEHPEVATDANNLGMILEAQGARDEARALYGRALRIWEARGGASHPAVATGLNNLAGLEQRSGNLGVARAHYERALAIREASLGADHPETAQALNNLASVLAAGGDYPKAAGLYQQAIDRLSSALGAHHPAVAATLESLAGLRALQGDAKNAVALFTRALQATEDHVRTLSAGFGSRQRLAAQRSTRYRLDNWLRFAPTAGTSGYAEVLRLRGLVTRVETEERILRRRGTAGDLAAVEACRQAERAVGQLANGRPRSVDATHAGWQRAYVEAAAEAERLRGELARRMASTRGKRERVAVDLPALQTSLAADTALVDVLRVGDAYVAWVVRRTGREVRVSLGDAAAVDAACATFVAAVADVAADVGANEARATGGKALRALAWAPVQASLGEDVKRVVLCPDEALAAVPFAALPGRAPGTSLLDDYALSYTMQAHDLVPETNAPPVGTGALVVGGVDYDHADAGSKERPLPERPAAFAAADRAPAGNRYSPLTKTREEAEALRDRFGNEAATLLLGADATEGRLREAVKGKRFVHVATHGFAREDLLAGLSTRKIGAAWTSADTERQFAVGHDPMLLSGLAMAGANAREGGGDDDGILTALEASYLDLDGVDLVTLSACETAKGTAESGEGVQGLVAAFQMAGARRVIASLWNVDDEATRRLMDGVYERMLRKEARRSPADALREAALALRDWKDPAGRARFAAPRYWAAFVAYGR